MLGHHTTSEALDRAFEAVPRSAFLPAAQVAYAHQDVPLDIGHRQTSSQPSTVRTMLALLDVQEGQRVLDVGAGSGWTTALLAHLVGPDGTVDGVELEPALAAWGAANLAARRVPWATLVSATPGELGLPDLAPFDRVLVSAEAHEVPAALVAQLAVDGGVMVCPVAGRLARVTRRADGPPEVHWHGHYRFVPLRETLDRDSRA